LFETKFSFALKLYSVDYGIIVNYYYLKFFQEKLLLISCQN